MKALSIRPPWWHYVIYGGKTIENRSWRASFRGRVAVHASTWWHAGEIQALIDGVAARGLARAHPTLDELRAGRGHLIGTVEIVDCVADSASPWFVGPYGFVLRAPTPLAAPIRCKGRLGFFEVGDIINGEDR